MMSVGLILHSKRGLGGQNSKEDCMMHWLFIENCFNSWNQLPMVLGFSRYDIEQWAVWLPLRHYSTYTASSLSYYSLSFIYIIHFDKRLLFKKVVSVLNRILIYNQGGHC